MIHELKLDEDFQRYLGLTYLEFADLVQRLGPDHPYLTDHEIISNLQDLYYLLLKKAIAIKRHPASHQAQYLQLEIKTGDR